MAYLVVLSEKAEASLRQIYVRERTRWEDVKKALAADPHATTQPGAVRCVEVAKDVQLCTFRAPSFPFLVIFTIDELAGSGSGVVIVRSIIPADG